jgi:hypothetical protein
MAATKEAPRQASATRTPTTTTSTGRAMPIEAHAQGYWIKIREGPWLRRGEGAERSSLRGKSQEGDGGALTSQKRK